MKFPFFTIIVATFLTHVFGKYLWGLQRSSYESNNDLAQKPAERSLYIIILNNAKKYHPTSIEDDESRDDLRENANRNDKTHDTRFKDLTRLSKKNILRQMGCEAEETNNPSWGLNETETALLVQEQHKKRVKDIIDFMRTHMLSTKYFHDEMKRILKQHNVKDELRVLIEYLEHPDNRSLKYKILDMYKRDKAAKIVKKKQTNVWRFNVNKITHQVAQGPNDYDEMLQ